MIPLREIDLFGKAGFAAWGADRTGREVSGSDIDPSLGLGVQYRNGRFAVRAEVEALILGFEGDDPDDVVDVTTFDIGRNIRFREEISRKSGMHIVAATVSFQRLGARRRGV